MQLSPLARRHAYQCSIRSKISAGQGAAWQCRGSIKRRPPCASLGRKDDAATDAQKARQLNLAPYDPRSSAAGPEPFVLKAAKIALLVPVFLALVCGEKPAMASRMRRQAAAAQLTAVAPEARSSSPWESLQAEWNALWQQLAHHSQGATAQGGQLLAVAGSTVQKTAAEASITVQKTAAEAGSHLQKTAAEAGSTVQSVAAVAGATLKDTAAAAGSSVQATAAEAGSTLARAAAEAGSTMQQAAATSSSVVQEAAAAAGTTLQKTAAETGSTLQQAAAEASSTVQSAAAAAGSTIQKTAAETGTQAQKRAAEAGSTLQAAVVEGGTRIQTATTISSSWLSATAAEAGKQAEVAGVTVSRAAAEAQLSAAKAWADPSSRPAISTAASLAVLVVFALQLMRSLGQPAQGEAAAAAGRAEAAAAAEEVEGGAVPVDETQLAAVAVPQLDATALAAAVKRTTLELSTTAAAAAAELSAANGTATRAARQASAIADQVVPAGSSNGTRPVAPPPLPWEQIPDRGAATPVLTVVGAGMVLWDAFAPMGQAVMQAAAKSVAQSIASASSTTPTEAGQEASSGSGSSTSANGTNGVKGTGGNGTSTTSSIYDRASYSLMDGGGEAKSEVQGEVEVVASTKQQ